MRILPCICRGGGPAKLVEGFFLCAKNPSTALRAVPLPTKSWGGCVRARSLGLQPVEGLREFLAHLRKIALDALRAADHNMVGAGDALGGHDLASERAETALHAVANHGAPDLLGDGEADAHHRVRILA